MTTPPSPVSKYVEVNGLRLHYLDWGNPQLPPIVCVHGLTSTSATYAGFAERFRDRFHELSHPLHEFLARWSPALGVFIGLEES